MESLQINKAGNFFILSPMVGDLHDVCGMSVEVCGECVEGVWETVKCVESMKRVCGKCVDSM